MKSEVITLRLNSEIVEMLRQQAQDNLRTLPKQLEYILRGQLKSKEVTK